MTVADRDPHSAHIFYVDSRFERLARRPGGVPREQALQDAQKLIDAHKETFDGWLERELQQLQIAATAVDANPESAIALDSMEHVSSQIRDLGETMGYKLVTFVAGSLCRIIEAIRAGASYDKDILDCHVNALLLARADPYRDIGPDEVPEMSSGLRRVVELARNDFLRQRD